jgi:hypothetical protein
LRETNAEKKFYERIGVIKMQLSHQHTAMIEMCYKDSAKEMQEAFVVGDSI